MSTQEVKKVITAVDKSTKAMSKVTADLSKVMTELKSLTEVSEALAFDIEEKSSELRNISANISEEERKAKAELNLRILENAEAVLDKLLSERKLAKISTSDLSELQVALDEAKADNQAAIDAAVKSAETGAAISKSSAIAQLKSEHAVETAELKAQNSSLQSEIAFLKTNNEDLKKIIESEREARVKMSENASQPTINVNGGK
jgi:chromosome segregation ATPase